MNTRVTKRHPHLSRVGILAMFFGLLLSVVVCWAFVRGILGETLVLGKHMERRFPFFQISTEGRHKLLHGLLGLRWGDRAEVVIAALGEPSESRFVSRKEDGSFLFRYLRYDVCRWEKECVNVNKDLYVKISFDEHDQLIGVFAKLGEFSEELRSGAVLSCPPQKMNPRVREGKMSRKTMDDHGTEAE